LSARPAVAAAGHSCLHDRQLDPETLEEAGYARSVVSLLGCRKYNRA